MVDQINPQVFSSLLLLKLFIKIFYPYQHSIQMILLLDFALFQYNLIFLSYWGLILAYQLHTPQHFRLLKLRIFSWFYCHPKRVHLLGKEQLTKFLLMKSKDLKITRWIICRSCRKFNLNLYLVIFFRLVTCFSSNIYLGSIYDLGVWFSW